MNLAKLCESGNNWNIDTILRLKVKSSRNAEIQSALGEASWSGSGGESDYSSDYFSLLKALQIFYTLYFKDRNYKTLVDVGCGYGRMGMLVASDFCYSFAYHGVEINPNRVRAANRAKLLNPLKLNFEKVKFEVGDVSVNLPDGDIYYMYDPVNEATLCRVLRQITQRPDTYIYFRRGRPKTYDLIEKYEGLTRITEHLFRTKA